MGKGLLIFVTGIDGSGKTTVAEELRKALTDEGVPAVRVWFRFPYLTTLPILLIARLVGATRTYAAKGKVFSVHFFERFWKPFAALLLIDFAIHYLVRVLLRKALSVAVIVERGPVDTLVDVMADGSVGPEGINGLIGRVMISLQRRGFTVCLDASYETVTGRRPEALADPKFRYRYLLYELIKGSLVPGCVRMNTEAPIDDNRLLIKAVASVLGRRYGYLGYGKLFKNPYLRGLFSKRTVILATNWVIQGALIADPLENAIRFCLDAGAVIAAYAITGNLFLTLAAFLVAHSVSYVINSNGMHVKRFFRSSDPSRTIKKVIAHVEERQEDYLRRAEAIVIFGSFVRGEESRSSDVDIRVIRGETLMAALKAYTVLLRLRLFALREGLPLDAFMHTLTKLCRVVSSHEVRKMIVYPASKRDEIVRKCGRVREG